MHVELRHLRYFLAVADELNFTRAAERLRIAQPALSAQIRALESLVGCPLFRRTTRKVELTPAGAMLLEDAREIVRRADEAVAKLRAVGRGERGLLRISFAAHGAGETGLAILRRFSAELPSVETELVSAATLEELQRHVRDRVTDVGFVWLPLLYDELAAAVVLSEPKLVAMHPEHRLAATSSVHARDLCDEAIVAPWSEFPAEFVSAWFGPFRPAGRRPSDPEALSVDESLAFASRGLALYCVPESASRFYQRPDVVFRRIVDVPPAEVAVAWRRDDERPLVRAFADAARATIQSSQR
ncbi:MAG: LysR substrate-binding domain-containing protein [Actinomycetota bacterium]|nr:LysR substrate-binding domain-containing protein [Actinomycetota bacterium]